SDKTPLSFCIPDEKDEFIVSLALIQFLIAEHNEIVTKTRELKSNDYKFILGGQISSRFVSPHHMIIFDENELITYLQNYSEIEIDDKKIYNIVYNLERIENLISEKYFVGKPLLKLEVPTFNFLNEERSSGTMASSFKKRIKQVELPRDIKNDIIKELGSITRMRNAMMQVQECISFLLATIVATDSTRFENMNIVEYARDALLSKDSFLVTCKSIAQNVQLKHLL